MLICDFMLQASQTPQTLATSFQAQSEFLLGELRPVIQYYSKHSAKCFCCCRNASRREGGKMTLARRQLGPDPWGSQKNMRNTRTRHVSLGENNCEIELRHLCAITTGGINPRVLTLDTVEEGRGRRLWCKLSHAFNAKAPFPHWDKPNTQNPSQSADVKGGGVSTAKGSSGRCLLRAGFSLWNTEARQKL